MPGSCDPKNSFATRSHESSTVRSFLSNVICCSDVVLENTLRLTTMDALLCGRDGVRVVQQMCAEMERVLAPGGTFVEICLSSDAAAVLAAGRTWRVRTHTVSVEFPASMPHACVTSAPGGDSVRCRFCESARPSRRTYYVFECYGAHMHAPAAGDAAGGS